MAIKRVLKPQYYGDTSKNFWARVNAIPRNEGGETAYVLGCVLQDLERRVLTYIHNCEARRRNNAK